MIVWDIADYAPFSLLHRDRDWVCSHPGWATIWKIESSHSSLLFTFFPEPLSHANNSLSYCPMINSGLFGGEHTQRDCLSESMNMSIKEEKRDDGWMIRWTVAWKSSRAFLRGDITVTWSSKKLIQRGISLKNVIILNFMLLETCMDSSLWNTRIYFFSQFKVTKNMLKHHEMIIKVVRLTHTLCFKSSKAIL